MTAKRIHVVPNSPFPLIELNDLLHFRSNLWAGVAFVVDKGRVDRHAPFWFFLPFFFEPSNLP